MVAAATAMALVAGACSGGRSKPRAAKVKTATCHAGTISGSGSNFIEILIRRWIKDYETRCRGVTVHYEATGSPSGIQQLTAGGADFAASDAVMTPEQEQAANAKSGQVLHIPWSGGGVAVEYHLPGLRTLKLTSDTLAGIFSGAIRSWDDPRLKADNTGVRLPATAVHVVYRSDPTPATASLTGYLTAAQPSVWSAGAGDRLSAWPTGEGVDGTAAMTTVLERTAGAIGYQETPVKSAGVGIASLKNAAGDLVLPSPNAMTSALSEASIPADLKVVPNYTAMSPSAYPMTFPTWVVVFARFGDTTKVDLLKDFLHYAVDPGQTAAAALFYAPLPAALRQKDKTAIDSIVPSTTTTPNGRGGTTTTTGPRGGPSAGSPPGGAPGTVAPRNGGALILPLPPGGNGGATDLGVVGTSIALGNVSTLSGPEPGLMSGAVAGTEAFFSYQNSLGGIYGRGLRLVSVDDGFSTAQNQSDYAGLVDKVFGFVGSFSAVDDGAVPVLAQHQDVPDVSEAVGRAHFGLANNFSVAPFPPGWQLGPLNYFKAKFPSAIGRMAIFALDTQEAKDAMAGEEAAAKSVGYHFSYSRVIAPTESDFTDDIVNMTRAGVQGIVMLTGVRAMVTMAQDMQRQGFRVPFANWSPTAYDPAFLVSGGATDGSVLDQPLAMYGGEDATSEVQLFLRWLHQVAPNQRPDLFSAYGWESARLFVEALAGAGPRPTRGGVIAQLRMIDNFDGNGMLAPAGPASKRPPTCFMTIGVSGGHFVRSDPSSGFLCNQGGYYYAQ